MVTAVAPVAILEATPAAERQPAPAPVQSTVASQPSLRLVIEETAGSGQFVYKMLDSVTGEVVNQFPREEVIRMGQDESYKPGDLIGTEV